MTPGLLQITLFQAFTFLSIHPNLTKEFGIEKIEKF